MLPSTSISIIAAFDLFFYIESLFCSIISIVLLLRLVCNVGITFFHNTELLFDKDFIASILVARQLT